MKALEQEGMIYSYTEQNEGHMMPMALGKSLIFTALLCPCTKNWAVISVK